MRTARVLVWTIAVAVGLCATVADPGGQAVRKQKVSGYAEWRHGDLLVVDGQRLRASSATKVKGKGITAFGTIPLGHEVEASGVRSGPSSATSTETRTGS